MKIIKLGLALALAVTVAACQKPVANVDGARIAAAEPPLDRLTYQIHMPWPSRAPAGTPPATTGEVTFFFVTGGCRAC